MKVKYTSDDYLYALENAAEFLEGEESEDDIPQIAANHAAAKMIRDMVDKLLKKKPVGGWFELKI